MSVATITKPRTKPATKAKLQSQVIPLGNGVKISVSSAMDASFVKWAIEEAKAGKMILPKRSTTSRPKVLDDDRFPKSKRKDWWADYEYVRADKI